MRRRIVHNPFPCRSDHLLIALFFVFSVVAALLMGVGFGEGVMHLPMVEG